MARRKVSTTIYITPEQNEALKLINERTKVPVAEVIRQGIDMVLEKRKADWQLQAELPLAAAPVEQAPAAAPPPAVGMSDADLDELERG